MVEETEKQKEDGKKEGKAKKSEKRGRVERKKRYTERIDYISVRKEISNKYCKTMEK